MFTSKIVIGTLIVLVIGIVAFCIWRYFLTNNSQAEVALDSLPIPTSAEIARAAATTQNPDTNVVITTDVRDYSNALPVTITLTNMTNRDLEIENPFYVVERFMNDTWVTMRYLTCECGHECKEAAFHALTQKGTYTYTWERTERWCKENTLDGMAILPASRGIYRIKASIAETNESHSGTARVYYSPVFSISE